MRLLNPQLTHYQSDDDNSDLTDNAVIARYGYTVQSDGRRTRVVEGHDVDGDGNIQANEQSQIDWTYDDAGRLVTEVIDHYDNSHDQTLNFTYDLTGNRVERTKDLANDGTINEITSYTHDDNDRLLTEATSGKTTTYAYTGTRQTGKTVNDSGANEVTTVTYGYDLRGRMASVNTVLVDGGGLVGDETVTYDYDSSGLRVGKTVTNLTTTTTETKYLFDTQNHTGYQQVVREEVTVDGTLDETSGGWDSHDYLERGHSSRIRSVDKPMAALIKDLKARGMLDDTLVVWTGEFGRTPDNNKRGGVYSLGRGHNIDAMTMLFAGGGVKPGVVGATDELGAEAVENVHPIRDVHLTLMHLLGLDDNKLTYFHAGRYKQLSQFGGEVIREIVG